jgi:hypothetical protein
MLLIECSKYYPMGKEERYSGTATGVLSYDVW